MRDLSDEQLALGCGCVLALLVLLAVAFGIGQAVGIELIKALLGA